MNILFISQSRKSDHPFQDPSVRYRCYNPAESLIAAGYIVDVTTIDMASADHFVRYDLIIFHRPSISRKLEKLVNAASKLNKKIVADYDDLIFNPLYAELSPPVLNHQSSLSSITTSFQKNYEAINLFSTISVSTTPLKKEVKRILPWAEVSVLHNFLSSSWLQHNSAPIRRSHDRYMITYLPGTNSHHHDFAVIEPALQEYLEKHPETILRVVGQLQFSRNLFARKQLDLVDYLPYPLLPKVIQDSWITIAPLADTLFNHCKSGLKYLESAAFGVPIVASPIQDMQRLKSEALLLAQNQNDWMESLNLLKDSVFYKNCQEAGSKHVHFTNSKIELDYHQWYRKIVNR